MFRVERRLGRLVEVRAVSPVTLGEIAQADTAFGEAAKGGQRVVICADYRRLAILTVDQADQLLAMLRRRNRDIELSAILVGAASATAVLQIERVITEAKNPDRKCFRAPTAAAEWLRPRLTTDEATRMDVFLASND